jgi:long-chain-fatty-acid--[acyl-carrier-protein] ligase
MYVYFMSIIWSTIAKIFLMPGCGIFRWMLLALRYRISIKGIKELKNRKGVLILPNHPALIDPVILISNLRSSLNPRPVVVEDFLVGPLKSLFEKHLNAIAIPNSKTHISSYKRFKIKTAEDQVVEALKNGDNVLFYPAGQLMRSEKEDLGSASGLSEILSKVDNPDILLVRTKGLYGSSFSKAPYGERPNLIKVLTKNAGYLILNLFLFMPKRKVEIEIIENPAGFPVNGTRKQLNGFLQNWYNEKAEIKQRKSYLFWYPKYLDPIEEKSDDKKLEKEIEIPRKTEKRILKQISKISGIEISQIESGNDLTKDLELDSLQVAELLTWMADEFYLIDLEIESIRTVSDVFALTLKEGKPKPEGDKVEVAGIAPAAWFQRAVDRKANPPDSEKSVQWNFLKACRANPGRLIMADKTFGALTYKRAATASILLAGIFKEYPEENIGIMLPASNSAMLVSFAILIAGKTPVQLNWTSGTINIQHAVEQAEIQHIITSAKFLDRIEGIDFAKFADLLVELEEVREKRITFSRKIKAFLLSGKQPETVLEHFKSLECSNHAVILFTSGSENIPKAVPLSHKNVLSNICASLNAMEMKADDTIFSFLPPFHSFGFTVTGLLPILSGIKAVYYPNPTDFEDLVKGISEWRPAIICGTPDFISGILNAAQKNDLSSIKMILTGAEKAPAELFKRVEKETNAVLIEGYGITECSPVISVNRKDDDPKVGVGSALPGITVRIIHPETLEEVKKGEDGMIAVSSDSVFDGYLKNTNDKIFHEIENLRYYLTGDIGSLDENNNIIISGRLKRFIKIGGEMISLPAMEYVINEKLEGDEKCILSPCEDDDKKKYIAAVTTSKKLETDDINSWLRDAGFSNLYKVRKCCVVDEIPLLGSGKVDFRGIAEVVNEKSNQPWERRSSDRQ